MTGKVILCPSVIHTGHHFMRYRIFEPYFIAHPPHVKLPNTDNDYVLMGHFEDTLNFNERWSKYGEWFPAFIPIRHPARNYQSLFHKGRSGNFIPQWEAMIAFTEKHRDTTKFLHIDDLAVREYQARDIMMSLNFYHTVDWSVKRGPAKHDTTAYLELTDEMIKQVPQEFIDFYEEMKK